MRIYVAGPMTGLPHYNYPAFAQVTEQLRASIPDGSTVVSPHELHLDANGAPDFTKSAAEYLRAGLEALLTCDTVVFLPDWKNSRGARLEWQVADALDMTILDYTAETMAGLALGTALGNVAAEAILSTLKGLGVNPE